jgi:hypothetical protein
MYARGDRVVVQGYNGRRAVLRVWEQRGQGIVLSSEAGYFRAIAGDDDAPLVGFPLSDVQRRAEPTSPSDSPNGQQPPS